MEKRAASTKCGRAANAAVAEGLIGAGVRVASNGGRHRERDR